MQENTTQNGAPSAQPLQVKGESVTNANATSVSDVQRTELASSRRRRSFKPSHKATFMGLMVVALILAANGAVVAYVIKANTDSEAKQLKEGVTLSSDVLGKLGVDRNPVGGSGTELSIGPATKFASDVTLGGGLTVAGKFTLNSSLSAADAQFTKLQAGDVAVDKLNINGDLTTSNLNLRQDLAVAGSSRLQGPVTITSLMTVNNNMNVSGNLAVGGTLSAREFQVGNLTLGSHLITRGSSPSIVAGGAVGGNGTVSISGNDASGTIAVNAGTGAGGGMLANVTFNARYDAMPHVVVTAVGRGVDGLYVNRSAQGFSISVTGTMSPGGYAFDYIVMQ